MGTKLTTKARIYIDKGCQTYTAVAIYSNGMYSRQSFASKEAAIQYIKDQSNNTVLIKEIGG